MLEEVHQNVLEYTYIEAWHGMVTLTKFAQN